MDAVFNATSLDPRERIAIWLVAIAPIRDEFPWLYDTLREASRAVNSNNARVVKQLANTLTRMIFSPVVDIILTESIDRDRASSLIGLLYQMPDLLHKLSTDMPPPRSYTSARVRRQAESAEKE